MAVAEGVIRPGVQFPRRTKYMSRLLFHWRAADLLLGHDPTEAVLRPVTGETPTFSRGTAGGYTIDRFGRLRQHAQGMPRVAMVDLDGDGVFETPGALLEGQRTNVCLRSEEIDHGAWTDTTGTPVTTANDAVAPDGTISAEKIEDDDAAGFEERGQAIVIADDSTLWCWSVHVKKATGTPIAWVRLRLSAGAPAVDFALYLDPATGGFLTSGGTSAGVIDAGDYWRAWIVLTNNSSGNVQATGRIAPAARATGDLAVGVVNSAVGSNHFWGAQLENDKFPSSYIPTVGSSVQRNGDVLSHAIAFGQRDMTMLARFHVQEWLDLAVAGSLGIMAITDADDSDYLRISKLSTQYQLAIVQNGAGGGAINTAVTMPAAQQDVSVVAQYDHANGRIRIDAGSGAFGSWLSVDDKLAANFTTAYISNMETAAAPGYVRMIEAKVAAGLQTATEMGKLF